MSASDEVVFDNGIIENEGRNEEGGGKWERIVQLGE